MHKLITADKFDEEAVRAQAEKMSKDQIDRQVEMAKVRNQMFNLLALLFSQIDADRKSTRLNSSHNSPSRMPSSA